MNKEQTLHRIRSSTSAARALAGSDSGREARARIRIIPIFFLLAHAMLASVDGTPYKKEIAPYVAFLKGQNTKPVDYVLGLFARYDLVILCERFHPEATQYDFIFDLIRDERFIEKIGHVFSEIGTSSMNGYLRDFLFAEDLSEAEVERRRLHLYRNFCSQVIWEKFNLFDFLRRLYALNDTLAAGRKIDLRFSDMPFSWEGMTRERYKQFQEGLGQRDRVMADQIIRQFSEIGSSRQPRKKALVILNYRHAFNDAMAYPNGKKADNAGRYLFEAFPGRVANVLIHSVALLPGSNDRRSLNTPISGGKWDAAFAAAGDPGLGFNLGGNAFGEDHFDYFPFFEHGFRYQDIFTGYVFFKPLKEHRFLWGTPRLFADGYDKIIPERMAMAGFPVPPERMADFMKRKETLVENTYDNLPDMLAMIDQWLLPAGDG